MDKIKKFFEKKKTDAKFKLAGKWKQNAQSKTCSLKQLFYIFSFEIGEGHKLNEPSHRTIISSGPSHSRSEVIPNAAQQQAAAAAVARLEKRKEQTPQQRSAALIRARVLKELEQEKQPTNISRAATQTSKEQSEIPLQLAVSGVYYKCPLIGIIWIFLYIDSCMTVHLNF